MGFQQIVPPGPNHQEPSSRGVEWEPSAQQLIDAVAFSSMPCLISILLLVIQATFGLVIDILEGISIFHARPISFMLVHSHRGDSWLRVVLYAPIQMHHAALALPRHTKNNLAK